MSLQPQANGSVYVAYLGLGSNLGERVHMLTSALHLLNQESHTAIADISAIYETDPVGLIEQPAFLNMACRIETHLSAVALLQFVLDIEHRLGRVRTLRWGPRTIDIDILLYHNVTIELEQLQIPHPRLMERAFVLVPLLEVLRTGDKRWEPGFIEVQVDSNGVRRWTTINWPRGSEHFVN
jgi:2-amino-4-hydroxy-6-hydroxymethyldihydropteridine diphosphokinase